ncbi:SRSO17 transposase [Streptomyces achromogenes]|nr:SRSO17 transposase [Streptomyces achromogenes]
MQHLLCRASWDADAVRDDVREYVVEHLHDEAGVLVVHETGDVKKGTHTGGVQRQYTGTAGRTENFQVAVHLLYAGARGHAAVDRELYIPAPGRATRTAAGPRGSARTPFSRPSRNRPG